MLSIRNINPVARAVGTMGAVVALVGGVTFAQLTSNTVTLANNTISSATATLTIGLTGNCSDGGTSAAGMNFTNLQPGVTSSPYNFCIDNTGSVPLNLTAAIPGDFTGSALSPADVTLHITCGPGATTGAIDFTSTVAALNAAPEAFGSTALNNGTNNILSCAATATLASTVTSSGALTPFNLTFVGTAPDTTTPTIPPVTPPTQG